MALRAVLAAKDPQGVAAALELPPLAASRGGGRGGGSTGGPAPAASLLVDGTDYGGIEAAHADAARAAAAGDAPGCHGAQVRLHSALNHALGSSRGNWLIPALQAVCRGTARAAAEADAAAAEEAAGDGDGGSGRNDHSRLQGAVTLLQESFSKTLNDRTEYDPSAPLDEEGSKKAGVLSIVNQLFACYFRLNTLRLCKNLVRPVESRDLHNTGAVGDMVTYRYFVGRLSMFEDQYAEAEANLDYALRRCHRAAVGNKRRILTYLVPVKLLRGRLPTARLLRKYGLDEFLPLVEGIRRGDLRTFNDGLHRYQNVFIRNGTYLLLEKCKTVAYRNLFKRVHTILDRSQVRLDLVARSFKWLGMEIDLDEVECILANLIFRGYVRGYISHSKRILVLSKKEPFPKSAIVAT